MPQNLPIMLTLCLKLANYAIIMLDTLACLLCLKLCQHNQRRPNMLNLSYLMNYLYLTQSPVDIHNMNYFAE